MSRTTASGRRTGKTIGTVVVATDFSESSFNAAKYALRFFSVSGARVLLLHVSEGFHIPSLAEGAGSLELQRQMRQTARKKLEEWRRKLGKTTKVDGYLKEGRAWQKIVAFAKVAGADMIIMGSHGYTGLQRLALGSTAERVVRHAPCSVLVVREE